MAVLHGSGNVISLVIKRTELVRVRVRSNLEVRCSSMVRSNREVRSTEPKSNQIRTRMSYFRYFLIMNSKRFFFPKKEHLDFVFCLPKTSFFRKGILQFDFNFVP